MKKIIFAILTLTILVAPSYAADPSLSYTREHDTHQFTLKGVPADSISGFILHRDHVSEFADTENDDNISVEGLGEEVSIKVKDATTDINNISNVTGLNVLLKNGTQMNVPMEPAATLASTTACSWLTFAAPTKTSKIAACDYGSTSCAKAGWFHTGRDYAYSSTNSGAYASADGTVYRIEKMSSSDHGMGNNVILEHVLSNCSKIYTTYSHLASISTGLYVGKKITRGTQIGTIGGSGYGNSNYWTRHLHFEAKTRPVTNNSCGSGTYWGYTPSYPDNYCYKNPSTLF